MLHLSVPDMSCTHCEGRIQKILAVHPSIRSFKIHLASKTVDLELQEESDLEDLLKKLEKAGYPALLEQG